MTNSRLRLAEYLEMLAYSRAEPLTALGKQCLMA